MYDYAVRLSALSEHAVALDAAVADRAERGRATIDRLRREPFRVLVIGEFSRGKSTFINALVGEKILPVHVEPTTAVICVITPSAERAARVVWHDPSRPPEHIELPVDQGSKALTARVTAKNTHAAEIKQVEIRLPLPHLRLPVEIVDTPGVNDTCQQREEVTYEFLGRADAAIMLLDLHQPLSASEQTFLRERVVGRDVTKILFVVNKVEDQGQAQIDRALTYIRKNLVDIAGVVAPEVIPVSAKLALRGKADGDETQLRESRFLAFEERLVAFLTAASGRGRIDTARLRLHRLATESIHNLSETRSALRGEAAAMQQAVARATAERDAAAAAESAVRAEVELAVGRFEIEAVRAIRARAANARRQVAEVGARTSFPSEADIGELRSIANLAARDAATIPRHAAEMAYRAVSHVERSFGSPGAQMAEVTLPGVADGQTEALIGTGIGAAIGGFVGGLLLGPITGIPLAALGSWIGSKFGGSARQTGNEIVATMNKYLSLMEADAQGAVRRGLTDLRGQLSEAVLSPRTAAKEQVESRRVNLARAAAEDDRARAARLSDVESRLARLNDLASRLSNVAEWS